MSSATLLSVAPRAANPPAAMTTRELYERIGDVPLWRVCVTPMPGMATEQDALDLHARTDRLFEFVDGIIVEKVMGLAASFLAGVLIRLLGNWVAARNLGAVLPPDAMLRLRSGLVRIPDVSFIPWSHFPNRQIDVNTPVPNLYPVLAVEVLSDSNTPSEMAVKREEYFRAGTILVWIVDPRGRTVEVFTGPNTSTLLRETDTLDGAPVFPGFSLPLVQLFAELDPH